LGKSEDLLLVEIRGSVVNLGKYSFPLAELKKVKEGSCYLIKEGHLPKLAFFSEDTNFYYKLIPTKDWPTATLSSTPMHRHTHLSPQEDTLLKIKEIAPLKGKVLDTCCGLGYTSIVSAREAEEVYTFERDRNMLELAKYNPYSQELFTDKNIFLSLEDINSAIRRFPSGFFSRIIHDPPTFKYSPELYSLPFYRELYRVLQAGGLIYHYAPSPHKTRGEQFPLRIIANLKKAGFKAVEYHLESSGIRAVK
jgi:predicted methyltransferase